MIKVELEREKRVVKLLGVYIEMFERNSYSKGNNLMYSVNAKLYSDDICELCYGYYPIVDYITDPKLALNINKSVRELIEKYQDAPEDLTINKIKIEGSEFTIDFTINQA